MEPSLYKIELTYTREDYEQYFKFYKWVLKRIQLRLAFYFILFAVVGAVVSYQADNWIYLGVFILFGCCADMITLWLQNRVDRKVMDQEMKAMPVVYRFFSDRMTISNASGTEYAVKYPQLYAVCDSQNAIYIMVDKNTAAIIPKRNCPKGLIDFILGLTANNQQPASCMK